MAEKVAKVGVKKAKGYLYFIDRRGNVSRAKMARGGRKRGKVKQELVKKVGVKKAKGYLYFIDKRGDISRAKMVRGGRRKKRRR
jgi:20S proteasome alpha/beta subunit